MTIQGTFKAAQPIEQIKEGFEKRTFQIDTDEKYNPVKCFELMRTSRTNNIEQVDAFEEGDQVEVSFNINCREYNGKWYTSLQAWKVSLIAEGEIRAF